MDSKLNDMFRSAPQAQVMGTIKEQYRSYEGRTQYSDFHFGHERDANNFARNFGGLQPNKNGTGGWVVRL